MEVVLASATLLVRRLHVCTNDTITDSALAMPFQRSLHVAAESNEAFDDASCAENNDLNSPHPSLPVLI